MTLDGWQISAVKIGDLYKVVGEDPGPTWCHSCDQYEPLELESKLVVVSIRYSFAGHWVRFSLWGSHTYEILRTYKYGREVWSDTGPKVKRIKK